MNDNHEIIELGGESTAGLSTDAPAAGLDYDRAVEQFYAPLYKFAFCLTGNESDGADLTQDTYRALLLKGGQIRDRQKIKSWLFTTLYRKFLGQRRHRTHFPEVQIETLEREIPAITPDLEDNLDASALVAALQTLQEKHRAPLVLFYLQDLSYREIADALGLPIGTIMSRLSRGKEILRKQLEDDNFCPSVRQPGRVSQSVKTSRSALGSASENVLPWRPESIAACP